MNVENQIVISPHAKYFFRKMTKGMTPQEFRVALASEPNFTLNMCDKKHIQTALHIAVELHNIPVIEAIVEIGGKNLLLMYDNQGECPLHYTPILLDCVVYFERRDDAIGFSITEKLVELGTPIDTPYLNRPNKNLLGEALLCGSAKIAAYCIRSGMNEPKWGDVIDELRYELYKDQAKALEKTIKNEIYEEDVIPRVTNFKLCMGEDIFFPRELTDYILMHFANQYKYINEVVACKSQITQK